jgi:PAS domain S-box-containing protein
LKSKPVILLTDKAGLVLEANETAREFFGADGLVGCNAAGLFDFDVVSSDPEMLAAQWDALVAAASTGNAEVTLSAASEGKEPLPVSVSIEQGLAEKTSLFLTIAARKEQGAAAGILPPSDQESQRNLLEQRGPAGFFELNFREARVHYSAVWKRILGYADSELANTYETWLELIHPDDSSAAPDKTGRKAPPPGDHPFSVEFRMKHREGYWVWIQCMGVRSIGHDGRVERVCGLHIDISERKEIEETGLASDERLRALTEEGPVGAFRFDFIEDRCWLSPAFKRLVGFGDAEMPDALDSFLHLLPPTEIEGGLAYWFGSRGGAADEFVCTTRLMRKEGSWSNVLLCAKRHYSRKKELLGVVGFCSAIPDELLGSGPVAGQALADVGMLKETLSSIAEAVLVADSRGRISFANNSGLRLLKRTEEQILGKPVSEVFHLVNAASNKPVLDDPCEQALASEGPLPLNNQHSLAGAVASDDPIPIVWTARAIYGTGGKPDGVVIVFRNPEEMNLTPEELVKANRYEALALLAGGIAHDFNNLLTTILGGISLAKDNRNPSILEDSEKSCMTAKGLTKQLLAFAKGGTGVRSVVSAADILNDSVKIASAGSTVVIKVQADEGLAPVQVDRSQILQVFQNLIVNAIQAMPPPPHKGEISLKLSAQTLAEGQMPPLPAGNYLRFEVRDNGSGIRPENLDRIWDPFFTTKKHGTGLGLATVLSIVRKHGGQIGVQSELGVGTVFTVFLPASVAAVEVQARRAPSLRYGTGRILFMDDDSKICSLTAGMLESLEYKYDLAQNGEDAIKLYRSYFNIGRPYDVVIMDLTVIGGMGGEDAFKAIKQLDPDVRAIAASGYDNEDMCRRYLDMGFCGYLTKPYRVTDLGKVIKTVIG